MVWYCLLFKNIPQFVVIHTVKSFSIVNEAEVDIFFLQSPYFFYGPMDIGNLISGSSAFSQSSLYIWKSLVHILLKPTWRILRITLLTSLVSYEKQGNSPKKTYICFTDYAKTFDCVDHNKLWNILQEMGIPDHLTCLLRNCMQDKKQH